MAQQFQNNIAYHIISSPTQADVPIVTKKPPPQKNNGYLNSHAGLLSLTLVLLLGGFIDMVAINPCYAEPVPKTHRILYINSYQPGYSWSDGIHNGLMERLKSSDKKIEVSVEYLDSRRFSDPALQEKHADGMHAKYQSYRHDLVIVSDNAAFNFAIKHRARLFPAIPIVFCGYNSFRSEKLNGLANITGVNEELDFIGLVEQALQIQPYLRTLVFVLSTGTISSAPTNKQFETSVIPRYRDKYQIIILKNTPMTEIRKTLSLLPKESALFLVGIPHVQGEGGALPPVETGRLIVAASPVPVYTLWDFYLNTGALGGLILAGHDQGSAAAEIALKILDGQSADSIPVVMQSPMRPVFDYTAMKRFNIEMAALPENSTVINKPHFFYEAHKKIVWNAIVIFTALILFIILLVTNILRRIRAENLLQAHRDHLEQQVIERTAELTDANRLLADSEEKFRSLSDAAFEGIVFTEKGRIIEVNKAVCDMFGYHPSEAIQKPLIDFVAPEEKEDVYKKMTAGHEGTYESQGLKKDGSTFAIEVRANMFSYKGQEVRVAAIRDLTAQKQAEEEINALRGILPLCSICKKIRDDKGYWEQVDVYIDKYSEAEISHGLCPDCLKKHYPEIYAGISSDKKIGNEPQ